MSIRTLVPRPFVPAMLAVGVAASCGVGRPAAARDEAAVREIHEAIRAAALAGAVDRLAGFLDDGLTLSHAGIRQSKVEWLEAIRSADLRYAAIEDVIQQMRFYGKTAIVTGHRALRLTWGGREYSPRLQYTAVYVSRGKGWLLAAYHSDELREPPTGRPP